MSFKLFFIKQFVDKGILSVVYCNTDAILADLLTKAIIVYCLLQYLYINKGSVKDYEF